jgi:hypothetical protein
MKKLITLLGFCAACAAFGAESNPSSPYKWDLAVKPDAPSPTPQAEQVTFTELAATASSIPLYYSAQRNVPPLPFNPFPELQLFDIGDGKFVYDDGDIDYVSLRIGEPFGGR